MNSSHMVRVFVLASLAALAPFAIDTYLPAFHVMTNDLETNPHAIQQSLTFYLFPYALMTLFHGAISDAIGRIDTIKIGLGIFSGVIAVLVLGVFNDSSFAFAITTGFFLSLALVIYSWSPKNIFASSFLFILLSTPQFIAIFENVSGDMTININQRYSLVFLPILSYLAAIAIYFICYHIVLFYKSKDSEVSLSENSQIILSVLFAFLVLSQSFQYQKSFEKNIMYKSNGDTMHVMMTGKTGKNI